MKYFITILLLSSLALSACTPAVYEPEEPKKIEEPSLILNTNWTLEIYNDTGIIKTYHIKGEKSVMTKTMNGYEFTTVDGKSAVISDETKYFLTQE